MSPVMFYFGPWVSPGHYLHDERGVSQWRAETVIPWTLGQLDGGLQPHFANCAKRNNSDRRSYCNCPCGQEGPALVHHKEGWTALAFWDRTVDKRGACNSVYMAEGTFDFNQMVAMARERFAVRWNKMQFQVTLYEEARP